MIAYQFITALSDAKPRSHLIARVSCAQLPQTALVAEMRDSDGIADTRFGCAPFARIILLPDALWHDALTEGLLAALRPLFATSVSADIVLDATNIDDVVLAQPIISAVARTLSKPTRLPTRTATMLTLRANASRKLICPPVQRPLALRGE